MKKPPIHKSFGNALRGIFGVMRSERNFQIHLMGLIINIFLIVFLGLNKTDITLIFIVSFFVLITEILNTAIEKICDFVHPEFHKRIGFIKDISAGAVLLATFCAVIVGVLVYWKYVF